MAKPATTTEEISILPISEGRVKFGLIGTSPMIFNCMSEKARRELLMPKGRKTRADRAANLKHVPFDEYRASVYRSDDPSGPTRLMFPAPGVKGAMATAALDLPGTRKSEIGRLVWVEGYHVPVWGVPQLMMSVVRSADMAKTPDIRTRAILPEWGLIINIKFVQPKLKAVAIAHLLAAAGIVSGLGDFRQEKGKGSFGQFKVVSADDEELLNIMAGGGREAQDAALESPTCYDHESEKLFSWFQGELDKLADENLGARKLKVAA